MSDLSKQFISSIPITHMSRLQWIQFKSAIERVHELEEGVKQYEFLSAGFLEAMNDIGRYGFRKYGEQSFQSRRINGDRSRGNMARTTSQAIADHAREHFSMYLSREAHDYFGTDTHQLAAVAFNAMMEYYFAGLEIKPREKEPAPTP